MNSVFTPLLIEEALKPFIGSSVVIGLLVGAHYLHKVAIIGNMIRNLAIFMVLLGVLAISDIVALNIGQATEYGSMAYEFATSYIGDGSGYL